MRRFLLTFCSLAMYARAGIVMQVIPSQSPNTISPSYDGWSANALTALQNGLTSVGDPAASPTSYYQLTQGDDRTYIVSSFPSWKGTADPGTAFGPAFANESGNFLVFGLTILATAGSSFSLSGLDVHMVSTDPGVALDFSFDYSAASYSSRLLGIDAITGNPITSGPGTQLVTALYFTGAGVTWTPCPGSDQSALDCRRELLRNASPYTITGEYTLRDAGGSILGSASMDVPFVNAPEPAAGLLSLVGVLGLARRRRKPAA